MVQRARRRLAFLVKTFYTDDAKLSHVDVDDARNVAASRTQIRQLSENGPVTIRPIVGDDDDGKRFAQFFMVRSTAP